MIQFSYPLGVWFVVVLVGGKRSQKVKLYLVDSNGRLPSILLQYSLILTFNLHIIKQTQIITGFAPLYRPSTTKSHPNRSNYLMCTNYRVPLSTNTSISINRHTHTHTHTHKHTRNTNRWYSHSSFQQCTWSTTSRFVFDSF